MVVQYSSHIIHNLPPPATGLPQIISSHPSNKCMDQSVPSSSSSSLIVVLYYLFSIFTPGPPIDENSDNSDGDSLPCWNNGCANSPTCGPPNPLNPPSVPTPKLNLPVTLPLSDAVQYKYVATLFETTWNAQPKGVPELHNFYANFSNCKKGLRAGGITSGASYED